jgi:hypothetical protein
MKAHFVEALVDALTIERSIDAKGFREEALLLYLKYKFNTQV